MSEEYWSVRSPHFNYRLDLGHVNWRHGDPPAEVVAQSCIENVQPDAT